MAMPSFIAGPPARAATPPRLGASSFLSSAPSCSASVLAARHMSRASRLRRAGMHAMVVVGGLGATGAPHGKDGQRGEAERDQDDAGGGGAVFAERGVERGPADGGAGGDAAVEGRDGQ